MTTRFRHIFPKPTTRRVWWLHPGSAAAEEGKEGFLVVFVFFVFYSSFNHFPILLSYYRWTKRDSSLLHLRLWRYLPIFPINVRHRSLPDQINCNRDHIQKHISFLSKEEEKNTFLTLLLFTSQSFQLMWDGDLFQIKSIAIQAMQIFKFYFFVLSNLTVRLRFIFVRVENLSRTNVFFFPL